MSADIDLSDIDGTFEEMDRLLSVFQQKGQHTTEEDIRAAMGGVPSNVPGGNSPDPRASKFLKLDFPNGPKTPLNPAPNIAVKQVESPATDSQLNSAGLIGKQLQFQQPIRGSWKNLGPFTTTPFKRPVDGPEAKPRNHLGLDMGAPGGTPIYPIADGIVGAITYEADPDNVNTMGGTSVWVKHYDGKIASYYAHLDNVYVRTGQAVTMDTPIGTCGQTGNARRSSTHLHLGVTINGKWVDPASFIGNSPTSQRFVKACRLYALISLAEKIERRGK